MGGRGALQDFANSRMEANTASLRQPFVQHFANEGMRKTEPSLRPMVFNNQPRRVRRFQSIQQLVFIECAYTREHIQAECASEHRRQRECAVALLSQPDQALVDYFLELSGRKVLAEA